MNEEITPRTDTADHTPDRNFLAWLRRLFGRQPEAIAPPNLPLLPPPSRAVSSALPAGERLVLREDAAAARDDGAAPATGDEELAGPECEAPTATTSDSDEEGAIVIVQDADGYIEIAPVSPAPLVTTDINAAFIGATMTWLRRRLMLASLDSGATDGSLDRRAMEWQVRVARADLECLQVASPAPRFASFCEAFELSRFERDVLLLCLGRALSDEDAGWTPTFALAMRLADDPAWDGGGDAASAGPARVAAEAEWAALSPARPLRHWELIEITQPSGQALIASTLRADERIVNHLQGLTYLDDRLARLCRPLETLGDVGTLSPSQRDLVREARRRFRTTGAGRRWWLAQLAGGDPATKRLLARHLADDLGLAAYHLPLMQSALGAGDLDLFARLWSREQRLQPLALYLDAADVVETGALLRLLDRLEGVVILDYPAPLPGHDAALVLDAARPRPTEQREAWALLLGADAGDWPARLAAQFSLNLPDLDEVIAAARADRAAEPEDGPRAWAICRERARPQLDGLAQRISTAIDLDAVKLPCSERRLLNQIRDQTRHRLTVYDEFGFRDKLGRGLGISALFAGESGTGKTMAAEALAHELGLDLYRIDLATVVSKYIGESEKNFKRIFDAAEQSGAVLLFDEADAIFGKRSEVKDSHDRYANIEVSYLLQRMEAYEGLAILTTNMKSALDSAFLRRLRFVVTFPFPGAVEREAIWRAIFPEQFASRKDLDYAALARPSLTGGQIRNIALNAAFLAAARGEVLTMAHLKEAARDELRKQGRPLSTADFVGWTTPEEKEAIPA